jgi:hypothetical protein
MRLCGFLLTEPFTLVIEVDDLLLLPAALLTSLLVALADYLPSN